MKYENRRKMIIEIGLNSENENTLNIVTYNVDNKPISINDIEVILNNLHFLLENKYDKIQANDIIEILNKANDDFQKKSISELQNIKNHKLNVHNIEYIEEDINIVHSIEIKYNESILMYDLGLNDFIGLEELYNIMNIIYSNITK